MVRAGDLKVHGDRHGGRAHQPGAPGARRCGRTGSGPVRLHPVRRGETDIKRSRRCRITRLRLQARYFRLDGLWTNRNRYAVAARGFGR